MAPHSSTFAWKIPWMEEPGGLQSMGSLESDPTEPTSLLLFTFMHWRRRWQPTPVFLPGVSQGRGSLMGCRLWGRTESDTTEATQQQQQNHTNLQPPPSWPVSGISIAARSFTRKKIMSLTAQMMVSIFSNKIYILVKVCALCFWSCYLEKAMAPHSSTLAWKIPWMEEPGRLPSMGLLGVGHN